MFNYIFCIALALRLYTVYISWRNEKRLIKIGAVEFGKRNSQWLLALHFAYYFACVMEGNLSERLLSDPVSLTGLGIYVFAILVLYYVIYAIRHIWTVKLIIAPKSYHIINRSRFFTYIRHPNYFLNIIPELIGLALVFHSWFTLLFGLPIYLIPLVKRILQEENVMSNYFENYM